MVNYKSDRQSVCKTLDCLFVARLFSNHGYTPHRIVCDNWLMDQFAKAAFVNLEGAVVDIGSLTMYVFFACFFFWGGGLSTADHAN